MPQLPGDCLNEIFKYFEEDQITLRSCLLVNRLWCETSVKFLWRDVWDYSTSNYGTLIACLPNESKEILYKNGIIVSTSNSKPPAFNYASFCKILSINRIYNKVEQLLKSEKYIISQDFNDKKTFIVAQEIYKLFMNKIPSLIELDFYYKNTSKVILTIYPGAKYCLKNLSKLNCSSNISSEFFYQLSKICHNIQSLNITFENVNSKGLSDLISVQKNLKCLGIKQQAEYRGDNKVNDIIPLLISKHCNNLIKLNLSGNYDVSLLFVAKFINLQELELSLDDYDFEDFERLQYVRFPNLQILKIPYIFVSYELLITFLKNNGNNLREFYVGDGEGYSDNSLNLVIAKFCPNLRKLSTGFKNDEIETLQMILKSCVYLESIKIWYGGKYLSEKEVLESVVKYSHENLCEIILYHQYYTQSELLPDELESFLINWIDRKPQKSISLIIVKDDAFSLDTDEKNMEIIKRYIKLGVVKKFRVTYYEDDYYN